MEKYLICRHLHNNLKQHYLKSVVSMVCLWSPSWSDMQTLLRIFHFVVKIWHWFHSQWFKNLRQTEFNFTLINVFCQHLCSVCVYLHSKKSLSVLARIQRTMKTNVKKTLVPVVVTLIYLKVIFSFKIYFSCH